MSSDETYLESFLDSLSGLPNEIKRNLELMKDLDQSCSSIQENMRQSQQEYVHSAEEKVLSLEVVAPPPPSASATTSGSKRKHERTVPVMQPGVRVGGGGKEIVIPTTEELMQLVGNPEALQYIRDLEENALQQADEKVAISEQTYSLVDSVVKRLDADLETMEQMLQSAGQFEAVGTAKPDDLAAIQVTAGSTDWILAKVITHDPNTGMYKLSDEDVESSKVFHLPESQVVVLGNVDKLTRGDVVFAVYPDTTAFYQATVVQAPRKSGGSGGSFVMVNFVDDSDEHGVTHDKAVPLQHIMLPPYGVTLQ